MTKEYKIKSLSNILLTIAIVILLLLGIIAYYLSISDAKITETTTITETKTITTSIQSSHLRKLAFLIFITLYHIVQYESITLQTGNLLTLITFTHI
jgi:uncharacterized BrkB/YihY/UPF0761 family membrane protein